MQGEINPLDQPFMFEVMRITKFETGYVVNALGHTWACETPKSLAKRVQSWATELEQNAHQVMGQPTGDPGVFGSKIPPLSEPLLPSAVPTWQPGPDGANTLSSTPDISDDTALAIQREQLEVLCDALFSDLIQEDDFYRGIRQYCPDISGEEIGEAIDAAHDQNNAGGADEDLTERRRRMRANSVQILPMGRADDAPESGTTNDESEMGDSERTLLRPALQPVGENGTDQGQLRPLRRRRALDRTEQSTRPGMSHPRPEDVDRFDE